MPTSLSHEIQQTKDKFWAYVTVFGTLWGGLELTLGTFLHVLHVPKTGFIMVLLSSMLLVAQRQIYSARWSTLAAGVVAACIKSLSPGGIIIGPIVGILSEALIIELCMMAGSKRYFAAIFASSMALLWSQVQSVFNLWIFYGNDFFYSIIKVIEKFLKVHWTASVGIGLVALLLGIILVSGGIAGVIGAKVGRRAQKQLLNAQSIESTDSRPLSEISDADEASAMEMMQKLAKGRKQKVLSEDAIRSRVFLAPVAIISLVMQFSGDFWLSIAALVLWFIALVFGARSILKSIWWPKFWLFTLIISVLCGIILAWQFDTTHAGFQMDWMKGGEASVRMIVRGVYVFSLVSWLTSCAKPSEFLSIWEKLHLPGLGHALTRAYSLLPLWLDRMNELIKGRPGGFWPNLKYARECCYICLVEAAKQTEILVNAAPDEPKEDDATYAPGA